MNNLFLKTIPLIIYYTLHFAKIIANNFNSWIFFNFLRLIIVCGVAYPGELLVIMGSSGAGKTTLLNALTFRSSKNTISTGQVAINGQRIKAKVLDQKAAYVQQTDLFIGSLTVHEHLLFHAMVRMNKNINYAHRIERVDEVINEVTLFLICKNTAIKLPNKQDD